MEDRLATDWVGPAEAAQMLRISVATFNRKVDDGTLPSPSTVLGDRNPRWNVKTLCDAMAGIEPDTTASSSDIATRISEAAL